MSHCCCFTPLHSGYVASRLFRSHYDPACTNIQCFFKAHIVSAIPQCLEAAFSGTLCMSMAQSVLLNLQACYSGPGHGASSPYRAFGLALIAVLCMPLQHVSADSGESPCSALVSMQLSDAYILLHQGPPCAASSSQSLVDMSMAWHEHMCRVHLMQACTEFERVLSCTSLSATAPHCCCCCCCCYCQPDVTYIHEYGIVMNEHV